MFMKGMSLVKHFMKEMFLNNSFEIECYIIDFSEGLRKLTSVMPLMISSV
jgi:hypothetical protein